MLQAHREFQVVTPRTLTKFQGRVLVLPKVSELNDDERAGLKAFTAHGGRLVALGANASGIPESPGVTVLPLDPGGAFFSALEHDFAAASSKPPSGLLNSTKVADEIELVAPATVASNFGRVNGEPRIFLANFGGLVPSKIAIPAPAKDIRVRIPAAMGNSATYLPFLGEAQRLHGEKKGNQVEFNLPALERGAVVWVGETQ